MHVIKYRNQNEEAYENKNRVMSETTTNSFSRMALYTDSHLQLWSTFCLGTTNVVLYPLESSSNPTTRSNWLLNQITSSLAKKWIIEVID